MLTELVSIAATGDPGQLGDSERPKKVVVVHGGPDAVDDLESVLDAGHYDVVFVEAPAQAYSYAKVVRPDLIILCLYLGDRHAFSVLSMLQLDEATRDIPLRAYAVVEDVKPDTVAQVSEGTPVVNLVTPRMN